MVEGMSRSFSGARGRSAPWTTGDVQRCVSLSALGLIVAAVGWFLVSGRATYDEQMDVMSVAIFGVILSAVGNGFWILQGRRAVGERTRVLLAERIAILGEVGPASVVRERSQGFFVAGGDSRFFHTEDCALAVGRNWLPLERQVHESVGRGPCGVCVQ